MNLIGTNKTNVKIFRNALRPTLAYGRISSKVVPKDRKKARK
jgi:hypothetical protein